MTFDNNQDKDRHIAEVFVPVVEEKKLWVRLGIAKDDEYPKKILKINDSEERVCDVCGKAFKSGKALGGHMRIHVQQSKHQSDHMGARKPVEFKNKKKDYYKSSSSGENNNNMIFKKPICTICGKKFPSMKSLYGHMKSHPDRCWRGIIPPNSSVVSKNSSSSSLSEVEQHKIKIEDDHLENLVEDEKNRRVDLIKELWGWKVRARRGRRSIDSSEASSFEDEEDEEEEEDVEVLNAANKLMLMVNGIFESEDEAENSSPESKKRGYDQYEGSYSSGDDQLDDKDRAETDFHDMVIVENKSKKKRKKVKLSDLKLGQKDDHDEDKYYKCNTCGKCFSTFQALGGHRSSHSTSKSKIVVRESTVNELDHHKASLNLTQVKNLGTKGESSTTCGVVEASPSQVESSPGESSRTCQRVLGIDLNEMPQSMDEHEA